MISIPSIKPVLTKSPSADYYEGTIVQSINSWRIKIVTSTGFYKIEWWDGTTATAASGSFTQKSVVAPYDNLTPKPFKVYSIDNTTNQRKIGYITEIWHQRQTFNRSQTSTSNFRNCPRLQKLYMFSTSGPLQGNEMRPATLDLSGLKELTDLRIGATDVGAYAGFPGGGFNTTLTSVDVTGCSSLQQCYISKSQELTSVTGLNSAANSLIILVLAGNLILSSLRIQNCSFNNPSTYGTAPYNYLYSGGADISNCAFNGAALDQIYTDLAAGDGYLLVSNNTGTSTDNPSIATAKGYTVLGS
jgi:hypothetical protein